MLTAAKADLEPHVRDPGGEQGLWVEPARLRQRYRELRQQRLGKPLLSRAQRSAAAAPLKAPPFRVTLFKYFRNRPQNARRSSPTRSSRSQEKPPSTPGSRPKWP